MSEEFEKLKEALRKAPTDQARKEAAEAMKRYLESKGGKGSKPTLVSLSKGEKYPTAIPLEQIPDEIQRNPEFFEIMRRILKA